MNTDIKKKEVVVVMPVFSGSAAYLKKINSDCMELVDKMPGVNWTIIIINDGSIVVPAESDLAEHLIANVTYHYYHYITNMGKGYAVRFGLNKAAEADIYIYTDYDFPFGTKAVLDAVNILIRKEADIVAADRGRNYFSFLPASRKLITVLTRVFNSSVLKLHFTDTQAGLKGMNNRSIPVMLHTSVNGFLFDLQFIKNAERQQLRIHGLTVECVNDIQLKNFSVPVIYAELKNLLALLFRRNTENRILSSYSGFGEIRYSSPKWTKTSLGNPGANHSPSTSSQAWGETSFTL